MVQQKFLFNSYLKFTIPSILRMNLNIFSGNFRYQHIYMNHHTFPEDIDKAYEAEPIFRTLDFLL
ncbi:hypothetical protein BpHYR1_051992 [Brachionus plicatilis]|uniref:Uncharacterized protein n=1 Tax=Brachionus plicatilis TaxID=10195 RepID=A0A3M7R7P1_BRAPC|nr:hypothetical protein BpHYR1_051992 [Brachionus plicatilis]